MRVWCNGAVSDASEVRIDPTDRGFTLGDGVFETVCIRAGRAIRLERHLARLRSGAEILGIPVLFPDASIASALDAVLAADAVHQGAARITLSRGVAARGLATPVPAEPVLLVWAQAGAAPSEPVSLITARSTRRNEHSPLSRIKSLSYLDGIIARREAEAAGVDDALLLNTAGRVAEGTVATLIAFADTQFWTPPVADGALPGIARHALLDAGIVHERSITTDRIAAAEALFLCNSLGVRAVRALDGRVFMERPELLARLRTVLLPD